MVIHPSPMLTQDDIKAVLHTIDDPEMPISIVDLGLVERIEITPHTTDTSHLSITILPTFVGCPALPMIESDIRTRLQNLEGVADVSVNFTHHPPWSVDRITETGRAALKDHGVVVPPRHSRAGGNPVKTTPPGETVPLHTSAVPCPFCSSPETELDSPFGPTRCRMIFYCRSCKNTFEQLKRV